MAATLKNVFSGVTGGWGKLEQKKKRAFVIVLALVVVLGTVLGVAGTRKDYSILFSNMALEDAGAIVGDLEAKGISYQLENGGTSILVDKDRVDSYRMELAMNNMLPDSSTGFEIFDETGMMVTEEDRQIMYQRALTGELQRTISTLEGIDSAKVHLVLPQKSIFETEQRPASASVVVDTKPAHRLSANTIQGIASLVAGAVDNLTLENIQIIDSAGVLLSENLTEAGQVLDTNMAETYQAARKSFEKEVEGKLKDLLGGVFGQENIRITVSADLDFDAEESTTVLYFDPVIRSEQVAAAGSDMDVEQVTGGNIDDNISNVIGGAGEGSSSYTHTINNELSTETRNTIKAPGKVEKISTSVVYNGTLSEEDNTDIQNMVAAAMGYDEERGDRIHVTGIRYAVQGEDPATGGDEQEPEATWWTRYQWPIIIVGSVLLLLLLLILIIKSQKNKKEDMEFQEDMSRGMSIDKVVEDIVVKPDESGSKAQKYAKDHPELAAELIKSWVRE